MTVAQTKRNYNLDILRCLAMLMVVVWHFYIHGIDFSGAEANGFGDGSVCRMNILVSQFIVIICSACVNLFVLISGYFLVSRPFNWKRVLMLWFQAVFYGFGISLLFYIVRPGSLSTWGLLSFLMPLRQENYWFFQKYFGLVCLAPFLSVMVDKLSQTQYRILLLVTLLLGCTLTLNVPLGENMGVAKGFSLIWFVFLFFWGGYLKRFPVNVSSRKSFYAFAAISVAAFLFILSKTLFRHAWIIEMPAYNSWGFFISLSLFACFASRKQPGARWGQFVSALSPYVFAVYLISDHIIVRNWLWNEVFAWPSLMDSPWFFPVMLGVVLLIFFSCIMIDTGRSWLFKMVGLDRLADWIGKKGEILVSRISDPRENHKA